MNEGLIVIQSFILIFSVLCLFGVLGGILFLLNRIFKVINIFSKRYIPIEGSFNVEIDKLIVEKVLEDYKYLVADFPKLMQFMEKKIKTDFSILENTIYEIIQQAETERLVTSTLESEISSMLNEEEEQRLKKEERVNRAKKDNEANKKFLLKRN